MTAAWEQRLEEFRVWAMENRAQPRQDSPGDAERSLARWVAKQRRAYRRGVLPEERVADLERLHAWAWADRASLADSIPVTWETRYWSVVEFWMQNGCRPVDAFTDRLDEMVLGRWLNQQMDLLVAGELDANKGRLLYSLRRLDALVVD